MTSVAWGAIITLGIFVLSNIGALVWSVSKISAILNILQDDVKELTAELKAMREVYLTREAFTYRVAQSDKDHQAMWRRIDELAEKV